MKSQQLRASYIADAAIRDTRAWMGHELSLGNEPCTISDPTPLRTGTLGDYTWTVLVEPDSGTPPNSTTNLRLYKLTATALLNGDPVYEIVADVQSGQSFARFSMFIEDDDPSLWDYAVSSHMEVTGPVHKNGAIRFLVMSGFFSGPPPTNKPFNGTVSTSQSSNVWSTTPTAAQYDYVFENGLSDVRFDAPQKPLPNDASILATAAYGTSVPATPPPGVTVNATGGIFVNGDVDSMVMEVNGSGNFQLTITQGADVTVVEEDAGSGSRVVTMPDGSVSTVTGRGNGVVFATGSIEELSGENKGAHTIAVDFDAGSDIQIAGSLTRSDTALGDKPTVTDDRLGLVAEHVYVAPESILPRNVASPLYVYATILATQRFEVKNAGSGSPGALAIFGGVAGRTTWRVANINLSTGQAVTGYGGLTGYGTPALHYDELLANEPPPEYPTTAETEMTVRSWRERPL